MLLVFSAAVCLNESGSGAGKTRAIFSTTHDLRKVSSDVAVPAGFREK